MADISIKFISQKISKIRWRPAQKQSLQQSDVFATGTWDDEENKVCMWRLGQENGNMDEGAMASQSVVDREPRLLCEVPHFGDVTGLEFLNMEHIVASSSTGTVTLYKHHTNSQTLGKSHSWERVHHHGDKPCPCTCLATREETVVSAGEDGRINVLNIGQRLPVRILERADSCTINSITFLKQFEFVTVNTTGQLKIFDLRQNSDDPSRTFSVTGEHTPLQCVDKHPGQPHIVATGGQEGMLCIWDLRQEKFPVTILEAHSSTMWEVKFHPRNPDHLFTCSEDGSVWHWNGTTVNPAHVSMTTPLPGTGAGSGGGNMSMTMQSHFPPGGSGSLCSPWLSLDVSRHKLEITTLLPTKTLPVNSIDIEDQTLLCGTDGESVYTISLPAIR